MKRSRDGVRRGILALCVSAMIVGLLHGPAQAQEPAAPERPTKFTADFSYVSTGGNSDAQTLAGAEKLEHKTESWLFTQRAGAVWGTANHVENANRYLFELRADREISKRLAVYGLLGWARDPFAAVDRRFDEGLGLVGHVVLPTPHTFDVQAGVGMAQRKPTLGEDEDFATGRLAGYYRYEIRGPKTYFETEDVYLHNFDHSDDYQVEARAALAAALANSVSMKIGYSYRYRNQPPDGFKNWDSTFASGIQISY